MITPANFSIFVTTVETLLGNVYDDVDTQLVADKLVTEINMTEGSQLVLPWMGLMPKWRVWYGARQPQQPSLQTYTLIPKPWENTYSIDRFTLDDTKFDYEYRMIMNMARQARRHPDYQVRDLLEGTGVNGSAQAQQGPDGLPFWNSAHPVDIYNAGAGTYTNDFLGGVNVGGVTVGGAFSPTALISLYEYMSTQKGEDGEPLGLVPDTLMHPVTLKAEVELVLKSTFFAPPSWGAWSPISGQVGPADNPVRRFGIEPIQNIFLANRTRWYLMSTAGGIKPLLWVNREPVHMAQQTAESDMPVFNSHMFQWGGWMRNTVGWGLPFTIARSGPA